MDFYFNAEEEVHQILSREVENENTLEQLALAKKNVKADISVCGENESMEMQPLLHPSTDGTFDKVCDTGNNGKEELNEPGTIPLVL